MRGSQTYRRKLTSLFLAISLLFAQFAFASHPLHWVQKSDGTSVELTCAYCIAGSHLQSAPAAPRFHIERIAHSDLVVSVRDVCDDSFVVSSRVTRGPPPHLHFVN